MLITVMTAIIFLLLAGLMFRTVGDVLHPAVTFPLNWGVILLLCGLAVQFGYLPVEIDALPTYYLGVCFFISGALISTKLSKELIKNRTTLFDINNFNYSRLFKICLVLHVFLLPQCYNEIVRITAGSKDLFEIAYKLRILSVTKQEVVNALVGNYSLSGLVIMPIMFVGAFAGRISIAKTMVVSIPWLIVNLLIGGRSGLMGFFTALTYYYFASGKTLSVRTVLLFFVGFSFVIIAGAQLVGKTDAKLDEGIGIVLTESTKSFLDYTLQGPILFSRYMAEEIQINPTWDALIFFSQMAEKIGVSIDEITIHQEFAAFGADGRVGNVYSIFLSILPKYGYLGVVGILFLYGFWAAYHHVRSRADISLADRLIAGYLFYAVVISFYLDSFGPSIYFLIKLVIITKVVEFVCYGTKHRSAHPRPARTEQTVPVGAVCTKL
jgi:oligosaccharide repeat unit polymerase